MDNVVEWRPETRLRARLLIRLEGGPSSRLEAGLLALLEAGRSTLLGTCPSTLLGAVLLGELLKHPLEHFAQRLALIRRHRAEPFLVDDADAPIDALPRAPAV